MKGFGLLQSAPRLPRPTTFSANHDGHLWHVRVQPRLKDAEDTESEARVPKKFEIIVNSLSKMIDRLQEVLIALDDRFIDLIEELIGKLSTSSETTNSSRETRDGGASCKRAHRPMHLARDNYT